MLLIPELCLSQDFFIGGKTDIGYGGINSQSSIEQYINLLTKEKSSINIYEYNYNRGVSAAIGVMGKYEPTNKFSLNAELYFQYQNFKNTIKYIGTENGIDKSLTAVSDFNLFSMSLPFFVQYNFYNIYFIGGIFTKVPLKSTISTELKYLDNIKTNATADLDGLNSGNFGLLTGIGIITEVANSKMMWGVRINYGLNGTLYTTDESYENIIDNEVDFFSKKIQDEVKAQKWAIEINDFQNNNFVLSVTYLF